ncbi:retention module-containing protein, partial [Salinicola aestuarinus]|uniref:retention module-containing protein n=1 Tax=Salinicola aestuarinus TaxID=1949082 RepID=UPI00165F1A2D
MLTIARIDGTVFILEPRKLLVSGMAIPEGATLLAPEGGRVILADGTVLPIASGVASEVEIVDGIATLGGDAAITDPDIAALQQAIAEGVDPTTIQEAPAAGQGDGGGGSLSGNGGFSSPFDISRVGRQEASAYRYQAADGSPADVSVTPATFSPQSDAIEATPPGPVSPTDGGDGGTTTPSTGGGDGDTTTPPTGGDDGDTTTPPAGGGDGDTTTPPTGGDDGDTTTPPTGGDDVDTTTPPTGGGDGDTTTPPTGGDDGGTATSPAGGGEGGTPSPVVTVGLDAIAVDDIVNRSESQGPLVLAGKGGGDAAPGDAVTITIGETAYSAVLDDNLTFSITVPGSLLVGNPSITVTLTHTQGDVTVTATSSRPYGVDIDPPSPTVQLDFIAGDDIVNAAESNQPIALSGVAGGDASAGDQVTLLVGESQFTTTVDENLRFSVEVPGNVLLQAQGGAVIAVISHADAAGNVGSATASRDYGVDVTSPTLGIELDTIAGDNIVNAEESARDIPVTGTVTGDFASGDSVTLTVGDQRYTGSLADDGSFSIEVPGSQLAQTGTIQAAVSHTDAAGNVGSASTATTYAVDVLPPAALEDDGATRQQQVLETGADLGVLANDSDPDSLSSELRVVAINGSAEAVGQTINGSNGGAFVIRPDGSYRFDPGTDFNTLGEGATATSQVSYGVSDSQGNTSTATLTVTVTGTNDGPTVAAELTANVTEDGAAVSLDLLTGAADIDSGDTLSAVVTDELPAGVSFDAATNQLTLDPSDQAYQNLAAGQTRDVVVDYVVRDSQGAEVAQTASFTVTGTNDAPVAQAATDTTEENTVLTGQVPAASDVDGTIAGYDLATDVGTGNGSL